MTERNVVPKEHGPAGRIADGGEGKQHKDSRDA